MTTDHQAALDKAHREYQRAAEKVARLQEQLAYWRGLKEEAAARLADARLADYMRRER